MISAFLRFSATHGLTACQRKVHGRAGRRDPNRVAMRIAQRLKVHGHRLGVAKQDRRTHQEEQCRQQNGSKWIDVPERIEANAAALPRCIVAK